MKVGIIAPINDLDRFAAGTFHLLLSHLMGNETYERFYKEQAKQGAWLTIDNSAYEVGESAVTADWLLEKAIEWKAREIVVPDVMHDMQGTLMVAGEAFNQLRSKQKDLRLHHIQLMLVAHGATIYEWGQCLKQLVTLHEHMLSPDIPFSIGVPKDYETFQGGRANLLHRFIEPLRAEMRDQGRFIPETHLLGMGEDLTELTAMHQRFPWLRSTDSVKPIVYALYGEALNLEYHSTPPYQGRPSNYFEVKIPPSRYELVQHNIQIVRSRVGDVGQ